MDISKYVQAGETFSGAHWVRKLPQSRRFIRNCKSDTPDLTHNVKLLCATHFQNPLPECRRHRCPQTDHKAFSRTVLNGSSRETIAERGLPNPEDYLTVQGLECSTICILTNG